MHQSLMNIAKERHLIIFFSQGFLSLLVSIAYKKKVYYIQKEAKLCILCYKLLNKTQMCI